MDEQTRKRYQDRLGWKRPEEIDRRDALMKRALDLSKQPDAALADLTVREAYARGYFASWRQMIAFWHWTKSFFAHPAPLPVPAKLWYDPDQLNQGDSAHCVGFASTQFLNCDPIQDHLDNAYGHTLYYDCKLLDNEAGGEDGTYVHTAAKILRKRGRIGTYVWGRGVADVQRWVLSQGPVVVGTDWYEDMIEPDRLGYVTPTGAFAGGHAYLVIGYDQVADVFTCQNSWGRGWGKNGRFLIKGDDFDRLLNDTSEQLGTTELPLQALRE